MTTAAFQLFFIHRAGWLLVHSLWQFTLIACAIAGLLRLFRHSSSGLRYWTCLVGLGLVVAAPVATYTFLTRTPAATHVLAVQQPLKVTLAESPLAAPINSTVLPAFHQEPSPHAASEPAVAGISTNRPVGRTLTWQTRINQVIAPWLSVLVFVWCVGVSLFAVRPAWSWYALHHMRTNGITAVADHVTQAMARATQRLGFKAPPQVFESTLARVPMVVGYFRPLILLPVAAVSGLPTFQLEAIFLHELMHIRRHDYLVNLGQTLLETIFFYHPAVWWLSGCVRREREHCCDEMAVKALGDRSTYCRALLAMEELRGGVPSLALGVKQGSLLGRVQRLANTHARPHQPGSAPAVLVVGLAMLAGLAASIWLANHALAQDVATEAADAEAAVEKTSEVPITEPNEPVTDESGGASTRAQELAVAAHAKASAIDKLPSFFIRVDAGTLSDVILKEPVADPIANLTQALDAPSAEADWFRYEHIFAWDPRQFVDAGHYPQSTAPNQVPGQDPIINPPFENTLWGTRELGGSYARGDQKPASHVLRANASKAWQDHHFNKPNYMLATTHTFWWGDNSYMHQCFSRIPPALSKYRLLESEQFDGEWCDVVESTMRQERLWISRETGHLRGYLQNNFVGRTGEFFKSAEVTRVAGRSFATKQEYTTWYFTDYDKLPSEKQLQLSIAWAKSIETGPWRPGLLVRFRDYREISPGIWWPFTEDRAQGQSSKGVFEAIVTTYRVQEVRTDHDLTETVRQLQPKEGEQVQDQRYVVPVNYKYSAGRTEQEILALVDVEYQKRLADQRLIEQLKLPYQELVGKPAPELPEEGWLGGKRPDLAGRPYLIHLWAVWCGPCKNDFASLRQLAEAGATIVGLHPGGSSAADVEAAIKEHKLGHPTFLAAEAGAPGPGARISGYPADMFPYYLLVDAQGKVAGHGSLHENNSELLSRFRELRQQADGSQAK